MKVFTHKKTDKIDSEVIAQLALNNMIQPSRVFPKDQRDFRSYKSVDQIIASPSPNVRKKAAQIREILDREISQSAALRLQICLELTKSLDDEIEALEKEIFNYAYQKHKR